MYFELVCKWATNCRDVTLNEYVNAGRIINVGSLAGQRSYPEPGLSMYSSTKHAIEGLSEALRFELARHGVDVSLIQPDVTLFEKYLLERHHRSVNLSQISVK